MSEKKERMVNLELLRIIAMMLVVVLHFLGKGNILGDLTSSEMTTVGTVAWLLESFAIVAVNVYMLISGYFLCESTFKVSRLLKLLIQIWMYSVGFGMLAVFLGLVPAKDLTTYYYVQLLFPVSMGHYWFMTAYVFLYLLLPFVGLAVKKMTKEQMQLSIVILFLCFCVLKSILPVRLDMDEKGYDCLWYLCVFLAAAYVRKYGCHILNRAWKGLALYLVTALAIFGGTFALHTVYVKTGSLGLLIGVCLEYNHILAFLASFGLFLAFCNMDLKKDTMLAKGICRIAPCTLGVYLLHENLGLRYAWQPLFGSEGCDSIAKLLLYTPAAVLSVFAAGILVEMVRTVICSGLYRLLTLLPPIKAVAMKIEKADSVFAKE